MKLIEKKTVKGKIDTSKENYEDQIRPAVNALMKKLEYSEKKARKKVDGWMKRVKRRKEANQ